MTTSIIVAGIVLIGVLGIAGRRSTHMEAWTVGERNLPRWTSWFLQAGENLTMFSFLGLAGIAFKDGVNALYVVGYLTISTVMLYFVAPRIRQLGAERGYLTVSEFMSDRFSSPLLGKCVAIVGALALLPYLQLQLTGLGLIVQLATGSSAASSLSMIIASLLVVIFVLWSGIRGIARVSQFKDIGMAIGLVIVGVGSVVSVGGITELFSRLHTEAPTHLQMDTAHFPASTYLTIVLMNGVGAGLCTLPHLWAPILAAESEGVLRTNYKWIGIYQLLLFVPIVAGLTAVLTLPADTPGNKVLFTSAEGYLPEVLVAIVAVFGASAAMVPASGISMGIATLVTRSLIPDVGVKWNFRVNQILVIASITIALCFGLAQSDISTLLLLTYGGTIQLTPAIVCGLASKVSVGSGPVLAGLLTGVCVVVTVTLTLSSWGAGFAGLSAVSANVLVLLISEMLRRSHLFRHGDNAHPIGHDSVSENKN